MFTLLLLAPVFLIFEVWQLVLSERYLGIKQIARGADPRNLGLSEVLAFFWTASLLVYWLWATALLFLPAARLHAIGLLIISTIGFSCRRGIALKRLLVVLTFEGALRIALLLSLCRVAWQDVG